MQVNNLEVGLCFFFFIQKHVYLRMYLLAIVVIYKFRVYRLENNFYVMCVIIQL